MKHTPKRKLDPYKETPAQRKERVTNEGNAFRVRTTPTITERKRRLYEKYKKTPEYYEKFV